MAYKKVKSNKGGAGIDKLSIQDFEANLSKNLYKIWNRMTSGSYFPPAVREHLLDKGGGKKRPLGIPTVGDRIAQQVVKDYIEPRLEAIFHPSSYGYRPMRSAHQALSEVYKNVWRNAWVIDLDISSFFENVNHEKLMMALDRHVDEKWVKMYVKRWLEAPIAKVDGSFLEKDGNGTPQGGVISPLLANLYLHYSFDKWMSIHYPNIPFVRYADDMVIHCRTEHQAKYLLGRIIERFSECNLEVHPEKSKIVYCKNYRNTLKDKPVQFDFLGFSFRPESKHSKFGGKFLGYDCCISKKSYSRLVKEIRDMHFHRWMSTWEQLAAFLNPKIRGWMQYYDAFRPRTLKGVFHRLHNRIAKWILNHFKRFKGSRHRAFEHLRFMRRHFPSLFYHWEMGYPTV